MARTKGSRSITSYNALRRGRGALTPLQARRKVFDQAVEKDREFASNVSSGAYHRPGSNRKGR